MGRRSFSPEFKRRVVESHVQGQRRVSEVCREHGICETTFRRWLEQYRSEGEAAFARQAGRERELREAQERIAELESALGRSAAEVDFLPRAFRRAGLPFPCGRKA